MMLERCHSAHDVTHLYRARHGLPTELIGGRPSIVTSALLGAVTMPQSLGSAVCRELGDGNTVPVLTRPRHERQWIFLVGASRGRTIGIRTFDALARSNVIVMNIGARVWLPISDAPIGWYWISPPLTEASSFPPRSLVLAAARSVLQRGVLTESACS